MNTKDFMKILLNLTYVVRLYKGLCVIYILYSLYRILYFLCFEIKEYGLRPRSKGLARDD